MMSGPKHFINYSGLNASISPTKQEEIYLYDLDKFNKDFESKGFWLLGNTIDSYPIFDGDEKNINPHSAKYRKRKLTKDMLIQIDKPLLAVSTGNKIYYAYEVTIVYVENGSFHTAKGYAFLLIDNKPQVNITISTRGKDRNVSEKNEIIIKRDKIPWGYSRSIITVIKFKCGSFLVFTAVTGEDEDNKKKQEEVKNAYANASNLGFEAFTFTAMAWTPNLFFRLGNKLGSIANKKPFDPDEKILYDTVENLDYTDSMRAQFASNEDFSIPQAAAKLLLDKVYGISPFGLTEKLIEKTIGNTVPGKVLKLTVKLLDIGNDAYSITQTQKLNIDKETNIKMLLFGFSLPEKTAEEFFSQLQYYIEYDVLGTGETYKQLKDCSYDKICYLCGYFAVSNVEERLRYIKILAAECLKATLSIYFDITSLVISIILL